MGLVSHLIGRWLRKRRVKKRKSALKDELEDLDLTANERGDLFVHVKYAAKNGGGLGMKALLGFLLVIGLGWIGFAFTVFEELVMLSLMSIPSLIFVGIAVLQYSKMRRANRITRLLKEQPRALLNVAPEEVGSGTATQHRQRQPRRQGQSRQDPQWGSNRPRRARGGTSNGHSSSPASHAKPSSSPRRRSEGAVAAHSTPASPMRCTARRVGPRTAPLRVSVAGVGRGFD